MDEAFSSPRILDHAPIRPHFLHSVDVIVLSADPRVSVFEDGYYSQLAVCASVRHHIYDRTEVCLWWLLSGHAEWHGTEIWNRDQVDRLDKTFFHFRAKSHVAYSAM